MRLYVAEKPKVGRSLAAYLAKKSGAQINKAQRYIEVGDDIVTWARGHLLAHAEPDFYYANSTYKKGKNGKILWSEIPLPIIPLKFAYLPNNDSQSDDAEKQLMEIGRLMKEADEIYNAADKDREGQLIFDEIVDFFNIKSKPIKRLWFSALDDKSFDTAFGNVMDNNHPKVRNMGVAALARGQADWIIGMNATRAMSLAHGQKDDGAFSIGRVQTPTLAIVVKRQMEIDEFISVPFYTPTVEIKKGLVLEWEKSVSDTPVGIANGRILDRLVAEKIVIDINNGLVGEIIQADGKKKEKAPPLPYSLPVIQSELSKKMDLGVDQVEKICQSLYERGMVTYSGTNCQYLPESMWHDASNVLRSMAQNGVSTSIANMIKQADTAIQSACWDDVKVNGGEAGGESLGASHHAIIPTGKITGDLSPDEKTVFEAICKRYIAQFYPNYTYYSVNLKCRFGDHVFFARETAPLAMGWREVIDDITINLD